PRCGGGGTPWASCARVRRGAGVRAGGKVATRGRWVVRPGGGTVVHANGCTRLEGSSARVNGTVARTLGNPRLSGGIVHALGIGRVGGDVPARIVALPRGALDARLRGCLDRVRGVVRPGAGDTG